MTTNWLDDRIINDYVGMLNRQHVDRKADVNDIELYCSDPLFITMVEQNIRLGSKQQITRMCTSLAKQAKLENIKKWIIPVNTDNVHWKLFIVLIQSRMILVYDSLSINGKYTDEYNHMKQLDHIRYFLVEYGHVHGIEWFHSGPWVSVTRGLFKNMQNDSDSCGVNILVAAECHMNTVSDNTIIHQLELANVREERKIIHNHVGYKDITVPFKDRTISGRVLRVQPLMTLSTYNGQGKHIECLFDPIIEFDRERIIITSTEKMYSNQIIWKEKLQKMAITSKTKICKNMPRDQQFLGFSRDHLIWNADGRLLTALQDSTEDWLGKLISKRSQVSEICIVSLIDVNSHKWRDQLIFERMLLELIARTKSNFRIKMCIVHPDSSKVYGLGNGRIIPCHDYNPQAFASVFQPSQEMKKNQTNDLNQDEDDDDGYTSETSMELQSDDCDVMQMDVKHKPSVRHTKTGKKHTTATNTTQELNFTEKVNEVMCLNDSIYHLVTSFNRGFVDIILYDSVDAVIADSTSHKIPPINLVISLASAPDDMKCKSIRRNVLRHTGGQFIWMDLTVNPRGAHILQVQKTRNVREQNNTQDSSRTVRDMSESSEDDKTREGSLLGSDSTSIAKHLYPVYEGEQIRRSVHDIVIVK